MKNISLMLILLFSASVSFGATWKQILGNKIMYKVDQGTIKNPAGAHLFNVCFANNSYITTKLRSTCIEYKYIVNEDDKYDVFPGEQILTEVEWKKKGFKGSLGRLGARYRKTCENWETIPAGEVLPTTTYGCTKTKMYDKNANNGKTKFEWRSKCVEWGDIEVPRTQWIDVYHAASKWHSPLVDGDAFMQIKPYTVPNCFGEKSGDLPDEDVPDTKK